MAQRASVQRQIKIFVVRLGGSLLPATPTVLCNLPFTVRNPAPTGQATLVGSKAGCYTDVSTSSICSVSGGAVTVTGGVPPLPITGTNGTFRYLAVLLSTATGALQPRKLRDLILLVRSLDR